MALDLGSDASVAALTEALRGADAVVSCVVGGGAVQVRESS
jgi:hypothetical protein